MIVSHLSDANLFRFLIACITQGEWTLATAYENELIRRGYEGLVR